MSKMQGQRAIVSGATRGIGRAVTLAFLEREVTVLGIYGADNETAEAFRRECLAADESYAERLHLFQCDVADYDQVVALFREIESRFDTVDILVNNAGIRRDGVVAMLSRQDWQRVLDVNLSGSFHLAKQAVLLMLKQKYGRIINVTSPMAHLGFAGQANYAASKAGQIGLMRSLAKETARRRITVNCVSPGFIDTDLLADLSDEQLAAYRKMVPMQRFGRPEEVAGAILFLASPAASYINGATLEVTGGL